LEGDDKYITLAALVEELSKALGVREEAIDIVDLDRADAMMKARALKCPHSRGLDIYRHIAIAKG